MPYDQLSKLKGRMGALRRDPHTYAIATSLRFADVFVPVDSSVTSGFFQEKYSSDVAKQVYRYIERSRTNGGLP